MHFQNQLRCVLGLTYLLERPIKFQYDPDEMLFKNNLEPQRFEDTVALVLWYTVKPV